MYNSTWRVVHALAQLKSRYIKWPDANSRQVKNMTNMEQEGFSGAVGKVNGTNIVFKYKPGGIFDGKMFQNQKKRYVLDLCAVCNSKGEIIYFLVGWPNSQHDAQIFASTRIHLHLEEFFEPGEYLLGDAAYTHTKYMVPLYKTSKAN